MYWAFGLVTLLPDVPGTRPQLIPAVAWLLSSAAGLVGAIGTEGRLRRLDESGLCQSPRRLWRLGVMALAPSWAIALGGHVLR